MRLSEQAVIHISDSYLNALAKTKARFFIEITQQNTGSVRRHPGSKVIMVLIAAANIIKLFGTLCLTWD